YIYRRICKLSGLFEKFASTKILQGCVVVVRVFLSLWRDLIEAFLLVICVVLYGAFYLCLEALHKQPRCYLQTRVISSISSSVGTWPLPWLWVAKESAICFIRALF